jgi:RNA recognition motif-containing protein
MINVNIFVGNLSFDATGGDVKKLFEVFGIVDSVAIVMEKEKKAPKSRGFGFVQMPDAQQALAAIAATNGKEFMGRVLDVNPARPKTEAQGVRPFKKKRQPKIKAQAPQYSREDPEEKKDGRVRLSGLPGTYRGGRRTHSYMKRQVLAGVQEDTQPRHKSKDNPMRWRKKKYQKRQTTKTTDTFRSNRKTPPPSR